MNLMLILLQAKGTTKGGTTNQAAPTGAPNATLDALFVVAQIGVLLFLTVAIIYFVLLILRTGVGSRTVPEGERSWLDYGNVFIVALGLAAVIIGFLVTFLFANSFSDKSQALGFVTAFFGAVTGLVGTFFGVKQSSDARQGAERTATLVARGATQAATVAIAPKNATARVSTEHTVTAAVTSADGTPAAGAHVRFTITSGPDATSTQPQTITADSSGHATFRFTNNGQPGPDNMEAAALGGKDTATVTFTQ